METFPKWCVNVLTILNLWARNNLFWILKRTLFMHCLNCKLHTYFRSNFSLYFLPLKFNLNVPLQVCAINEWILIRMHFSWFFIFTFKYVLWFKISIHRHWIYAEAFPMSCVWKPVQSTYFNLFYNFKTWLDTFSFISLMYDKESTEFWDQVFEISFCQLVCVRVCLLKSQFENKLRSNLVFWINILWGCYFTVCKHHIVCL